MTFKTILFFTMLSLIPLVGIAQEALDLKKYEWKNRLLLLFAPSRDSQDFQRQKEMLANAQAGLKDRDLNVFELVGDGSASLNDQPIALDAVQQLVEQFDVDAATYTILLIGKDGMEKRRQHNPLPMEELFRVIDAMPMRQREMHQNK